MIALVAFYRRQFHLLWRWSGGWHDVALRAVLIVLSSLVAFAFTAWYVPGISVRQPWAALAAACALAVISALTRPLLIALLSGISVLLVGAATLFVQAAALLLVANLVPTIVVDRAWSAVIASIVYAVSHTLVSAGLSLANDESFFGTLVRQLAARHRATRGDATGVVFIQIDGLSHDALRRAIDRGEVPTIARWSRSGLTLDRWEPLLPTQTSASQAGILHGTNDGIPGFRWWDKQLGRLLVSNHPGDAREIERGVSNGMGLLAHGASIGNLLSGDAPRSFLTASTIDDPAHEIRRSHVLDWFFITPYAYVRWLVLSVGEIVAEIVQAWRERADDIRPRGARGFPYPFARAATNVILRHLVGALVIEEMYQGTPTIYATFVDYDEIAHHAGIDRIESRRALSGIDRILALIAKAELDAPRQYGFVVLSDHGQTAGPKFEDRNGRKLEDVIAAFMGVDVDVHAATVPAERAGRLSVLHRAVSLGGIGPRQRGAGGDRATPPELVVAASGNLAHVSFPRMPGRVTREALDERYPDLVARLVREPGIGLVMVRTASGSIAIGALGQRWIDDGRVDGEDPVSPYGPHALAGLRRIDAMPNCGDLVVVAAFDPARGETYAFEEQIGSHGGLGGAQADAFVLHPDAWRIDGALVGAPALYEWFSEWAKSERARATSRN